MIQKSQSKYKQNVNLKDALIVPLKYTTEHQDFTLCFASLLKSLPLVFIK